MFNRRGFITVVGALLAAPVAVVKGWFEAKALQKPLWSQARCFSCSKAILCTEVVPGMFRCRDCSWEAYKKVRVGFAEGSVCDSCGASGNNLACQFYLEEVERFSRSLDGCIVRSKDVELCDTCAEKQGFLCKYRLRQHGRNQWSASYSCPTNCGKRGCPSLRSG